MISFLGNGLLKNNFILIFLNLFWIDKELGLIFGYWF
jgi:hypothetical protein